jgi:hypothetical protein
VASYLKSKSEPLQSGFEMVGSIDEGRGLFDLLFVAEFTQKQHGELRCSGPKKPHMEEFVGFGINSSVQPVSFVVDPNHCLVDRDPIRSAIASRL